MINGKRIGMRTITDRIFAMFRFNFSSPWIASVAVGFWAATPCARVTVRIIWLIRHTLVLLSEDLGIRKLSVSKFVCAASRAEEREVWLRFSWAALHPLNENVIACFVCVGEKAGSQKENSLR